MSQDFDYEEHVQAPDHSAFDRLNELVILQAEAEAQVARCEADLAEAVAILTQISERDLPELMEQVGLPAFTSAGGMQVSLKEAVRANIKEENEQAAFKWLVSQGEGEVIKNTVTTKFGRNETERATVFQRELQDYQETHGYPVEYGSKQAVHAATLSKLVRERLADGKDVDESVTVFRQRIAIVKAPS